MRKEILKNHTTSRKAVGVVAGIMAIGASVTACNPDKGSVTVNIPKQDAITSTVTVTQPKETVTITPRPETTTATVTPKPETTTVTKKETVTVTSKPEIRTTTVTVTKSPETTAVAQPDWIARPVSSEIGVPNYYSTTIDRSLGSNQIGAISGGPMTIDYVDQYGYGRTATFSGGEDRVTLAIYLGGPNMSARGLVSANNWVGIYNAPDGNPANQQEWQALINTKVWETMTQSTSVAGGAKFVDTIVIGSNKRLIYQNTFSK